MPRDVTVLGSQYTAGDQIPISLVLLQIPSNTIAIHTLADVTVYLNPSTGAVSMSPGAGLQAFAPHAGLYVPEIELTSDSLLSDVTFLAANESGFWSTVLATNAYREATATIWQGNLVLTVGSAPEAVTFQGAVKFWAGVIETIDVAHDYASITLASLLSLFDMTFPYRTYNQQEFIHMPKPGAKVNWGYTELEV
jgi:hypothetical protein